MEEQLRLTVGEEIVEGKATFTLNDMQVEITSPFVGVSEALHIPCIALPVMRYEEGSAITQRGLETARHLLREVHDACLFCEAHEEDLLWECRRVRDLGTWTLLRKSLADMDLSVCWFLLPLFLLMFFLEDGEMVRLCQNAIVEKFGRRLPATLVRRLLVCSRQSE